jgi:hypothetical protein
MNIVSSQDIYSVIENTKVPYLRTRNYPEIVAYTVQGNPLTQEQYLQEINIALQQIEQGKTIADEDLQKEMDTW